MTGRILAVLPPEVLHRIFQFTGETPHEIQREAIFRISHVCRDFHHVFALYPIRQMGLVTEKEILALSAKLVALEEARVLNIDLDDADEIVRSSSALVDAKR